MADQQHHKLVAADSADSGSCQCIVTHDVSGFFEHIISHGMSIMIVDVFEVVHIHDQSGQFFSLPQF